MRDLAIPKTREAGTGFPMAGDVDTRPPFQSVKDAVNLFVETGSPKVTTPITRKNSDEKLIQVEAQHHLMLQERLYYTDQFRSAEAAKAQALRELQMANRTLQQLTNRLQTLTDSKESSIAAAHAAKLRAADLDEERARQAQLGDDFWKVDLNKERAQYKATTAQLIASQQELANLRHDFDAVLFAKLATFKKSERAQSEMQKNQVRQSLLLKEVGELRGKLEQVKLASTSAEEEYMKLMAEKEELLKSHKLAKEKIENEIRVLKEEYVPTETLQEKLEETMEAIRVLQEQLNDIQSSDLYAIRKMASELENAKRALEEASAEEKSLQTSINSTKSRIEDVKREIPGSKKKALEAESAAEKMQADLDRSKAELERAMSGCVFIMQSCIDKLRADAETAGHEAQKAKKTAQLLRQESNLARTAKQETDEKLKIALKEAEEAKAAEKLAEEKVHNEVAGSRSNRKIRLSLEDFDSLNKKIEESKDKADEQVATALAQVEAINARETGISQKLEAMLEENESIQSEIKDALKKAEMAESARRLVETELQKWRQMEKSDAGKAKK